MKTFIVLLAVGAALAAPTEEADKARTKKSNYPSAYQSYAPPCAGGPVAPVALYLGQPPVAQPGLGLSQLSVPHYRSEEHKQEPETAKASEMRWNGYEQPASLSGLVSGPVAPAAVASASALAPAVAAPSTVGVFPAKVSNCAVPLLLSCSPNVVSGHLAPSHAPAYDPHAYSGAYRAAEENQRSSDMTNHELTEEALEEGSSLRMTHEMQHGMTHEMQHSMHGHHAHTLHHEMPHQSHHHVHMQPHHIH